MDNGSRIKSKVHPNKARVGAFLKKQNLRTGECSFVSVSVLTHVDHEDAMSPPLSTLVSYHISQLGIKVSFVCGC